MTEHTCEHSGITFPVNMAHEAISQNAYFANKTIEDYLRDLIESGIDMKDVSQKYQGMNVKIFVKDSLKASFDFESKIVEKDGRFAFVTDITRKDY